MGLSPNIHRALRKIVKYARELDMKNIKGRAAKNLAF